MKSPIIQTANDVDYVKLRCAAEERRLDGASKDSWFTAIDPSTIEGTRLWTNAWPTGSYDLIEMEGGLVGIERYGESVSVTGCAETSAIAASLVERIRKLIPASPRTSNQLEVVFWYYTPQGPSSYHRRLQAPAWKAIAQNYPTPTREDLDALQAMTPDETGGKLVLWQGEPGTGKTFALRALGEQWADWCKLHYVLDPERFFMEGDYLVRVILGEDQGSPDGSQKPLWRLIVLEDTGELLSKDAKERSGQGLSRLLNLCDGLLGQGLRVMVLITTNEEIGTLHKAVIRPGRCLSHIAFEAFDVAAANGWLKEHGRTLATTRKTTVAELYAMLEGSTIAPAPARIVGF